MCTYSLASARYVSPFKASHLTTTNASPIAIFNLAATSSFRKAKPPIGLPLALNYQNSTKTFIQSIFIDLLHQCCFPLSSALFHIKPSRPNLHTSTPTSTLYPPTFRPRSCLSSYHCSETLIKCSQKISKYGNDIIVPVSKTPRLSFPVVKGKEAKGEGWNQGYSYTSALQLDTYTC
jgi:hypothetical protein